MPLRTTLSNNFQPELRMRDLRLMLYLWRGELDLRENNLKPGVGALFKVVGNDYGKRVQVCREDFPLRPARRTIEFVDFPRVTGTNTVRLLCQTVLTPSKNEIFFIISPEASKRSDEISVVSHYFGIEEIFEVNARSWLFFGVAGFD